MSVDRISDAIFVDIARTSVRPLAGVPEDDGRGRFPRVADPQGLLLRDRCDLDRSEERLRRGVPRANGAAHRVPGRRRPHRHPRNGMTSRARSGAVVRSRPAHCRSTRWPKFSSRRASRSVRLSSSRHVPRLAIPGLDPARADVVPARLPDRRGTPRDAAIAHRARNIAILIGAIVVAYHYSLSTLLKTLSVDTPLAYLGLVAGHRSAWPLQGSPPTAEPQIHDRQLDYIVGLPPLLAASPVVKRLLPARLSAMFWVWRVDLLGPIRPWPAPLPSSSASGSPGDRVIAVGFLFLAGPLPYSVLPMSARELHRRDRGRRLSAPMHAIPVAHQRLPRRTGPLVPDRARRQGSLVSVASAYARRQRARRVRAAERCSSPW